MSYDLDFWRYKKGISLDDQEVYERLSAGEAVAGLEDLPIEKMRTRMEEVFRKGWTKLDRDTWEGSKKSFQLFTTPQFFRVDCYGLSEDDMNQVIEVAHEFECPLYDPQVGQRYEKG